MSKKKTSFIFLENRKFPSITNHEGNNPPGRWGTEQCTFDSKRREMMTIRQQKTTIGLLMLWLMMVGGSGCANHPKAVVVDLAPTCEEALFTGLKGFSDDELALLMDRSLAEGSKSGCWIPLVETCLRENRKIPHHHLAEAIKIFNKRSAEALFNKAVCRYLSDIAKGNAVYRPEDRLLLESYCRFLINSAGNAH